MSKSSPRVTSRMKKTVGLQREALPGIEETMDVAANLRERPMARILSLELASQIHRSGQTCPSTGSEPAPYLDTGANGKDENPFVLSLSKHESTRRADL